MDDISILCAGNPDKKIVGLDVTIYEGFVMDRLNSSNLMRKQKKSEQSTSTPGMKDRPSEDLNSPFASQPCKPF